MPMVPKPLSSVLVKPAGPDCNLSCTYCFYLEKASLFASGSPEPSHRMGDPVLGELVRQLVRSPAAIVTFAWQGGEPTLMGLRFFQRAVALQQAHGPGRGIVNSLQTNGLLIDESWATFLTRQRFLVGLSLDGPEHVHDRYRRRRNGGGTWSAVAERARLMLDAGVQVNALSVITDYAAGYPDEIYRFFRELGMKHMQFIPCLEADPRTPDAVAPFSASPERFGEFLCRVFDLWLGDFVNGAPTTFVRFFDSLFYRYVGREPPDCTLQPTCGPYLVVEHNGDVYPCDFYVDRHWRLGNLLTADLTALFGSSLQVEFALRKALLRESCRKCRWLTLCRGGCTRHRIMRTTNKEGDPERGENWFCSAYQRFFAHAHPALVALAERWQGDFGQLARVS